MALTRAFRSTVQARVLADASYGRKLLANAIDSMLAGDVDTGRALLRDYIKATLGFEKLGAETGIPPKSLIRMFGSGGNPQAANLFTVIAHLQRSGGFDLRVAVTARPMQ